MVEAAAAWALEMTLLTTMLVPIDWGSPSRTRNWSFWPSWRRLWVGSVPKKAVVSTPPKRSELTPSGMLISARGWVAEVDVGRVGDAQVEVGHVDRERAPGRRPVFSRAVGDARSSFWKKTRPVLPAALVTVPISLVLVGSVPEIVIDLISVAEFSARGVAAWRRSA